MNKARQCVLEPSNAIVILRDQPIASGGEGEIHVTADHLRIIKIFFDPNDARQAKIRAMANRPLPPPSAFAGRDVAWPEELVFDQSSKRFIGYVAHYFADYVSLATLFDSTERASAFPGWSYDYSINTASNLARAVSRLHQVGVVIGDVSPLNALVHGTTRVGLIDIDSVQFRDGPTTFTCPVATPDTTPPELQSVADFAACTRGPEHDVFGLSVLVFQLLCEGVHPFVGRVEMNGKGMPPTIAARISQNLWPYSSSKATRQRVSPPPNAVSFESFPEPLRGLFIRSFDDGHREPSKRPMAHEFVQALDHFRRQLTTCRRNPRHQFYSNLNACIWCQRSALIHHDPFPA